MADRTVSVKLAAQTGQYQAEMTKAAAVTKNLGTTVDSTVKNNSESFKKLGAAAGIASIGLAVGIGKVVGVAAEFEKSMSGVQAVSGASASEMAKLSDAALKAGASTKLAGVTAADAAKAEAELVKAGISVNDVLGGALVGSLSLAAAGQIEFGKAAEISAQAMNIFNLQGSDVGHVADVMAAAANKSAADVNGLGDALRQGGLVASQTGLSLEETVGAFSAFADSALIGSDAGTSLKTMLQRLTPQSEAAAGMMEQLGFSAYDAQGNFIGLEGLAGELETSFGGLDTESRNAALGIVFGSDAIRGANVLMTEGAEGVRGYVDAVNDQGAAARMAAIQNDNLKGDIEALGGAFETAFIENGGKVTGVLREITQGAADMVNGFGALPDELQNVGIGIVGAGTAALGVVGVVGTVLPRVRELSDALGSMGKVGQAAGSLIGPGLIVGGGVSLILGAIASDAGKAQRAAGELVETLNANVDVTDLNTVTDALGATRRELAELDAEWEELDGIERYANFAVGLLPGVDNAVAQNIASTDALRDSEEELYKTAFKLGEVYAILGDRLGLTEDEIIAVADAAGIDLLGNLEQVVTAVEGAHGAMAAGADPRDEMKTDLEAQAEAAKEANEALEDYYETLGDSNSAFTDVMTALDALTAAEQAAAEATAASTEDAADSWKDYVGEVDVSMQELIPQLEGQITAQQEWKDNLVEIAGRGRADVASELAKLGPEGAALVASFADATDDEMNRAGDLLVAGAADGGARAGQALDRELKVMEAIGRAGAGATASAVAAQLKIGADEVAFIAAKYGVNLAAGINPVLAGMGKAGISLVRQEQQASRNGRGNAMGDIKDAHQPEIARGGEWRVWAEPETQGEAYIPLANDHRRGRAVSIWEETGRRLGVRNFATGGFMSVDDIPKPPSVAHRGNMVGYAGASTMQYGYDNTAAFVEGEAKRRAAEAAAAGGPGMGGSTTGLVPEFLARFRQYEQALGRSLTIVSGFRSRAQQQVLYDRWVRRVPGQAQAAPPGRSNHERGLAIDHAPHSTAAMRATAGRFRLRYPMSFEPWHIEPFAKGGIYNPHVRDQGGPLLPGHTYNGTGRPERVIPMATGGIMGGSQVTPARVAQSAGAFLSENHMEHVGRQVAKFAGIAEDDLERVGAAWWKLAKVTDETVANQLHTYNLGADGYIDAADRVIETREEEMKREKEVYDNRRALGLVSFREQVNQLNQQIAAEEQFTDEWVRLSKERDDLRDESYAVQFEVGDMPTAEFVAHLNERIAAEQVYTREWLSLVKERDGILADEAAKEREVYENRYQLGLVSTTAYLANLDQLIAAERQFTDEWVRLVEQRRQIEEKIANDRRSIEDNRFQMGDLGVTAYVAILDQRLAAEERFTNEWVRLVEQRRQIEEEAKNERQEIEDNRFELGKISMERYVAILDARIAAEQQYTDAWLSLTQQRANIEAESLNNELAIAQNRYELGVGTADAVLRILMAQLEGLVAFSGEWMSVWNQIVAFSAEAGKSLSEAIKVDIENIAKGINIKPPTFGKINTGGSTRDIEKVKTAAEEAREAIEQMIKALSLDTRIDTKWPSSIEAIVANAKDQVGQISAWMDQLREARQRGISEAVLEGLNLTSGPEALEQLRELNAATSAQVAELNAITKARGDLAKNPVFPVAPTAPAVVRSFGGTFGRSTPGLAPAPVVNVEVRVDQSLSKGEVEVIVGGVIQTQKRAAAIAGAR